MKGRADSNPAPTTSSTPTSAHPPRIPPALTLAELSDPELTGIPRPTLEEMIRNLTPALALAREQTLDTRRGGRASPTPGTGRTPKLTPAQRILVTVLHQRKLATHDLLGALCAVTPMTTSRAVRHVLPILSAHGYRITASTARFRTPADITAFLAHETIDTHSKVKPAC